MATAIDFQALLQEELAKAKAQLLDSNNSECKNSEQKQPEKSSAPDAELQSYFQHSGDFESLTKMLAMDPSTHLLNCKDDFGACYYIPNFISEELEQKLLDVVYKAPDASWAQLKRRRLQCWGGKQKNDEKFKSEPMPKWCDEICSKMVSEAKIFDGSNEPNHILVNEYKPGEGIMAHKDGPMYHPKVAIISLKSTVVLNFYLKPPSIEEIESNKHFPIAQVVLEPRSCVVFEEKLYTDAFHMIHESNKETISLNCINLDRLCLPQHQDLKPEVSSLDRTDTRVSLTIRHVLQ